MVITGRLLTLAELDVGFSKPKYPMQVMMSYYQGCMVVRYITERWGFEKILDVLREHAPQYYDNPEEA